MASTSRVFRLIILSVILLLISKSIKTTGLLPLDFFEITVNSGVALVRNETSQKSRARCLRDRHGRKPRKCMHVLRETLSNASRVYLVHLFTTNTHRVY